MSSISSKKCNDIKVKLPSSLVSTQDKRPAKGYKLFTEPYANIFICARKKSGKTITIYNILKHCIDKKTHVIFLVSTLYKDKTYQSMTEMLDKSKIKWTGYTSLKDGKTDNLKDFIDGLTQESEQQAGGAVKAKPIKNCLFEDDEVDSEHKAEPKPSKYVSPEYLVILDDLSDELKSPSLTALLKKNRHYKMKIIVSSQHYNDILPESRKQCDYMLIFRNINDRKLNEIYRDCGLDLEYDKFKELYEYATKEQYNFLYVDCVLDLFRKNFCEQLHFH